MEKEKKQRSSKVVIDYGAVATADTMIITIATVIITIF